MKLLAPIIAALCLAAGCGGGDGASSPEEDVKDTMAGFVEAMIDERWSEACAMTTKAEDCLDELALAQRFPSEGGIEALLPSDWRERLAAADVTFPDDDHAVIPPLYPNEDAPTEFVRRDGDWLLVWTDET